MLRVVPWFPDTMAVKQRYKGSLCLSRPWLWAEYEWQRCPIEPAHLEPRLVVLRVNTVFILAMSFEGIMLFSMKYGRVDIYIYIHILVSIRWLWKLHAYSCRHSNIQFMSINIIIWHSWLEFTCDSKQSLTNRLTALAFPFSKNQPDDCSRFMFWNFMDDTSVRL